jgi:hypothetical protein
MCSKSRELSEFVQRSLTDNKKICKAITDWISDTQLTIQQITSKKVK